MIYFSLFPPPKYIQLLPVTHLNPPKIYSKFVQFFYSFPAHRQTEAKTNCSVQVMMMMMMMNDKLKYATWQSSLSPEVHFVYMHVTIQLSNDADVLRILFKRLVFLKITQNSDYAWSPEGEPLKIAGKKNNNQCAFGSSV